MRVFRTALLLLLATGAAGAPLVPALRAQTAAGRVIGRVVDSETGRPLPGARISVQGTSLGTLAGVDGRYVLINVPAGTRSLVAQYLGYGAKTITGVEVGAGAPTTLDLSLTPTAIAVEGVTVSAARERGTVSRALDEQRTAVGVVNAVTTEQIAKSPDSDAAAAVQRVSGVTVQDGKYVFVRGLGERYTTTALNGARIPSPEPERRVVPLDLFPSGVLQSITTAKAFTPNLPGDFSGARVNIETREYPSDRQVSVSASAGYTPGITGGALVAAPAADLEWLGLGAGARSLPEVLADPSRFERPLPQAEVNRLVDSFRNVWSPVEGTARPNSSLSVSVGGTDPVFGQRIGYLATGTYSYSQESRLDERRALALAEGEGETREIDRFEGTMGRESASWGGLLNLSTLLGTHSRLSLNNTFTRSADNEARRELGFSENLGGEFRIDRLRYVERTVRSNQLKGEHQLGERNRLDWSLTSSAVTRREPDRSEFVYMVPTDPRTGAPSDPLWFSISNQAAVRTFGDLEEEALEVAADYETRLGGADAHRVSVGGLFRDTGRDADNLAYSISANLPESARSLRPEQIFDGRFTGDGASAFRVTPLGAGGSYTSSDRLGAGYAMVELALGERLRLVTGARLEVSSVSVESQPTLGAPVTTDTSYADVLPAVSLTYRLTDQQNLRFSATQTLARPEYRELADIQYRDVIGGDVVQGNPGLRRTLIQNYDARWEWYPERDEVLSLALFAKRFRDPIEQIYLATSGSRVVTYLNAESARNYGVEVEARKGLGGLGAALEPVTVFANATLMHSAIEIGGHELAGGGLGEERPMVGQAPYVANLGVTYAAGNGASATLLYNTVGERIVSASEAPLPDVYEQPRHVLDLAVRLPFANGVALKLDAKNLLDAPYEITQGSVVREHYRTGRSLSLGVSWQP